jgi:hypothetical protein
MKEADLADCAPNVPLRYTAHHCAPCDPGHNTHAHRYVTASSARIVEFYGAKPCAGFAFWRKRGAATLL